MERRRRPRSRRWVGLIVTLLPWGFAVDRYGERWTLAVGLAACGVSLVGAAYAPGFAELSVMGAAVRPLFAWVAEATSWRVAFALAAAAPLLGWWALGPLTERPRQLP